jgi:hypothetical protein
VVLVDVDPASASLELEQRRLRASNPLNARFLDAGADAPDRTVTDPAH